MGVAVKNESSLLKKVLASSGKMASATFLSRILGLVREQVMASFFGASGLTDAFLIAYRIPNMLRDLFAEGAFSAAFVPIFTKARQNNPDEAKRLLWSMVVVLFILTSIFSLLFIIFAHEIVGFIAPTFYKTPDKFLITVNLLKVMSPFLVLISLAALFMGALNSLKVFFVPALAPALFNVVMILSMIFVPSYLKDFNISPIFSLAFGVIIGGVFQLLIQLPMIFIKKYGFKGPITLFSDYSKKIINRLGIGTIGIAATQINIIVTTIIASTTIVGAVSWLSYAFRLFQFPVGILSVSIAGSNLVHFSDAWNSGDKQKGKDLLKISYILSFLVIIPAMALLYSMSIPAVNLIFERGEFSRHDTLMSAWALRYYVLGLPFYGLYKIFVPTFYVFDRPLIPVLISVFSVFINIIFCLTLTPIYGFQILALGVSLSMSINILLQSFFINRELKLGLSFFFDLKIFKIIIAGLICFFITNYLTETFFLLDADFFSKVVRFVLIGFSGVVSYFISLFIFGELKILKRLMT